MGAPQECAFCGNDAVELTGEHIWSAWICRLFQESGKVSGYNWRYRDPKTGIVKTWQSKTPEKKLRLVCESCNSGWMSRLETRAKRLLSGVVRDSDSTTFSPNDLHLLASFAFKSAVLADHAHMYKDRPFFSSRARSEFGLALTIPPEVRIWVAAFRGEHRYAGRFDNQVVTQHTGHLREIEYYVFTYVAGHLVLQILAPRWKNVLWRVDASPPPALKPNSYWDPAVKRFWPPDGSVVSWPMPKILGDETIKDFINRFGAPVRVSIPIV